MNEKRLLLLQLHRRPAVQLRADQPQKTQRYYRQLDAQVLEMRIRQITHSDPQVLGILAPKAVHPRQLVPVHHKRSMLLPARREALAKPRGVRSNSAASSSEGHCGTKMRRLLQKGVRRVAQHRIKIIRRFRKFVHAVCLALSYFHYHPKRKQRKLH